MWELDMGVLDFSYLKSQVSNLIKHGKESSCNT